MPSNEQVARWAKDWDNVKQVAGKKIDSVQFAGPTGSKERLVLRTADGIRLVVEAQPDGSLRAWLSCCGKPDGDAPPL